MTSVCVFLAGSRGNDPRYVAAARACGAGLAARGWRLVYGGAHRGLMGELADAALAGGGEVYGVLPRLLADRELAHPGLTQLDLVDTMAERKARMTAASDAFLTLPGGFGTLDELFEVLTSAQLGEHARPIAIADVGGYYAPLMTFLDGAVASGLLAPQHRATLSYHVDLDLALDALATRLTPHA
jgi:uncharacterized protein (TIGR00730 family)